MADSLPGAFVHSRKLFTNSLGNVFVPNGIYIMPFVRKTQEGCGGLGGESPGAFPRAGPIFQQPFSLPEGGQTLAGIAFR